MISVHFVDDNLTATVESGQTLTDICDQHPTSILFGCRDGVCGTCLIEVESGIESISGITEAEQDMLEIMAEGNPKARLGCQCVIHGDVRLKILSD